MPHAPARIARPSHARCLARIGGESAPDSLAGPVEVAEVELREHDCEVSLSAASQVTVLWAEPGARRDWTFAHSSSLTILSRSTSAHRRSWRHYRSDGAAPFFQSQTLAAPRGSSSHGSPTGECHP